MTPAIGQLYSSYWTDLGASTLVTIDPQTGVVSPVGFLGGFRVCGLAWDSSTKTLYAVAEHAGLYGQPKSLIKVDPKTAAVSEVGPLGTDSSNALAHQPVIDVLYGGAGVPSRLTTVDRITGQAQVFGQHDEWFAALAYIPTSDSMVYSGGGAFEFGRVDLATGDAVVLNSTFAEVYGLAYDSSRSILYGLSTDRLLKVDPDTGDYHVLAMLNNSPSTRLYEGLVYLPIPEPSSLAIAVIFFAACFCETFSTRTRLRRLAPLQSEGD